MEKQIINNELFVEIKQLIADGKQGIAQAINAGLTATYWHIGKRINDDILKNKHADYGEQIMQTLSAKLVAEYGDSFSSKNLRRMLQFNQVFPNFEIVATLWRQLSWSHFKLLIPLKSDMERDFYSQMCRIERWSVRTLQQKKDSMLFERTGGPTKNGLYDNPGFIQIVSPSPKSYE